MNCPIMLLRCYSVPLTDAHSNLNTFSKSRLFVISIEYMDSMITSSIFLIKFLFMSRYKFWKLNLMTASSTNTLRRQSTLSV